LFVTEQFYTKQFICQWSFFKLSKLFTFAKGIVSFLSFLPAAKEKSLPRPSA